MRVEIPYRNAVITRTTAKAFAAVGRCIYCTDGVGPFTKEHIVPIGLGGGLILPSASCAECQRAINKVETYCMRGPFLSHRLANGLVRNLQQLGTTIPIKIIVGGNTVKKHFLPGEYPDFLCLPNLPLPPGMLIGNSPGPFPRFPFWVGGNEDDLRELHAIGNAILVDNFNAVKYFRVLAKMAHGIVVAEIGLDNFFPMLPEFILGKDDNAGSFLIGAWPEDGMPQVNGTCQIGMAFCDWEDRVLINVRLRLFPAHPNVPIYHIVVGALTKPLDDVLKLRGLQAVPSNSR